MDLLNKINDRSATVGVIGLGYVGLPLILEFGKAGFPVIGFDSDGEKIKQLNNGKTYIKHIPSERIQEAKKKGNFKAITLFCVLHGEDAFFNMDLSTNLSENYCNEEDKCLRDCRTCH